MRSLVVLAVAASSLVLALAACGGGGAPTTAALLDRLAGGDVKERTEAAQILAARLDPLAAAQLDRRLAASAAGRVLFRGDVLVLYRQAKPLSVRRLAAVRTIVRLRDPATTRELARILLVDRSDAVQELVAAALAQRAPLSPDVTATLTEALDAAGGISRDVRIKNVLAAGGAATVRALFPRLADAPWAREVVRAVGLDALPFLRGQLKGGADAQIAAAFGLLALRPAHPRALARDVSAVVEAMLPRLGEPNQRAEDVLAAVGKPAADRLVAIRRRPYLSVSGAERHAWEHSGATLAEMWSRNPASVASITAALVRRDYATIAMLDVFFVQMGRPGSEDVLIAALNAKGDSGVALDYIMCGNARLAAAGRAWASAHGYTYVGSGTTGMWGSARRAAH